MLRNNNKIYVLAFILAGMLCAPIRGDEPIAKEPAAGELTPDRPTAAESSTADIWSSIESTIQALADPFIPKVLKKIELVAPPVNPPVEVPQAPPKPAVDSAVMVPGYLAKNEVVAPPPPMPVIDVSGVIYNTDMPMAIINGRVCAVGEELTTGEKGDGIVKLLAVHAESIEVDFMGKKHTIPLEGK
jgi:hypothetical protein